MIFALLAATVTLAPPSVGDYFPLVPGTRWHYQDVGATYIDEVRAPEEINGQDAWPIVTLYRGKEDGRRYFRIEGDTVFLVAYDAKKPLGSPSPVLKLGKGRVKWDYVGDTTFLNEPAPLQMKCESAPGGKKNFFGQEVEVLEVKLNGTVGANERTAIKSNQVAYYAKGIGLVEMLSENAVGSSKSKSQLKLIKFEPAK